MKQSGLVTKAGLKRDRKNFARAFRQIKEGKPITGPVTVGGFPVQFVDDNGQDVTPWAKKGD